MGGVKIKACTGSSSSDAPNPAYRRDRLGSVVATSTDGGVAGASYRYDVYGSMTVQAESADTASELGFTGQLRLSGGLYVMGIRVYDSKLRQFVQPDILNPMSYTYAGGDPVNRIDPTGMIDTPSFQADHGDLGGSGSLGDLSPCSSGSNGRMTCGEEIPIGGKKGRGDGGYQPPEPSKPIDWGDLASRKDGGASNSGARERAAGGGMSNSRRTHRSYWKRVSDNYNLTNDIVPGFYAPTGMTLLKVCGVSDQRHDADYLGRIGIRRRDARCRDVHGRRDRSHRRGYYHYQLRIRIDRVRSRGVGRVNDSSGNRGRR